MRLGGHAGALRERLPEAELPVYRAVAIVIFGVAVPDMGRTP
jgi:hypothetical protein